VYNNASSTPSSNPAAYSWYGVSGGFGTTKFLFYQTTGGRQIDFIVATSSPSPTYAQTVDGVAIDLNLVSSSAGTPGPRGAIAMAYIVTPSNPNLATSYTLTTWFSSPRTNTVAPIGTGLTPVTGDTANFIYAAGIGQPNATYTYNGSTWDLVNGQVIAGNLIVDGTISGNTISANTISATNILSGTLTTALFTANTINGNIIESGTITADKLVANSITANTVVSTGATLGDFASPGFWLDGPSGDARFGNTLSIGDSLLIGNNAIVGANLSVGTNATISDSLSVGNNASIGNNLSVGNNATIGGVITLGTLNSNTVGTTQITPGSITTSKFTANTINGNIISAGTITADKLAANAITANTVVSTGATLGNFASPGFWLDGTTGNARFGNTINIGSNLIVGNNASIGNNATIGGNLTVTGLITGGQIAIGVVNTQQLTANSVSTFAQQSSTIWSPGTFNVNTTYTSIASGFAATLATGTKSYTGLAFASWPWQIIVDAPNGGGNVEVIFGITSSNGAGGFSYTQNFVIENSLPQTFNGVALFPGIPFLAGGTTQYYLTVRYILLSGNNPSLRIGGNPGVVTVQALFR
jgi:carbonic anhydrase/acetyltransferase-like protein (isoleucine patch superfamily)